MANFVEWSGERQSCKVACEKVILVRYAILVIGVKRFIVGDDFSEVGDGLSTICGVMPLALTVITDWDRFLNFASRTFCIFV